MSEPVGRSLPHWRPVDRPQGVALTGDHVVLEPIGAAHVDGLWASFADDDEMWTYMGYGPFGDSPALAALVDGWVAAGDPLFYVFRRGTEPLGWGAFLRVDPANGSIEIGHLALSRSLRGTTAATEGIFLLMRHAFRLGYRRLEWKCDALNGRSRLAADRLGFTFEGVFRNHMVYKGRNRDTAWYSIIDAEWDEVEGRFLRWLDPSNFDEAGRQISPLRG